MTPSPGGASSSPLQPGDRLGPYELLGQIGAGGMGEVYRARDTRLGRSVAIKRSAARYSDRFAREAHAVAALNHPHICTLYDVGPDYLVMELIEGKPLHGPLPLNQALEYAGQIASALDAAHRRGIVHRDLKPDNILLTKSGVKLLDFGLAKFGENTGSGLSEAVTITAENTIVGTLQYMSPEQVRGEAVDARSDIFSFGTVLYELLCGKRAFDAANSANLVARILTGEPSDIPLLQAADPRIGRLLKLCLAKDPAERWQNAFDLKQALGWIADAGVAAAQPSQSRSRGLYAIGMGLLLVGLIAGAWLWRSSRGAPAPEVTRFTIQPPAGTTTQWQSISPDGRHLAFRAGERLYIRSLDNIEPVALTGTEGAGWPFWSPDGRYLAFVAAGKLKKIAITGGPAVDLTDINTAIPGAWGADGTILIGKLEDGIFRVPDSGGTLVQVTKPDPAREETRHLLPQFLPGGRQFLFVAGSRKPGKSILYAASLDSPERTPIFPLESSARFAPIKPGSRQGYLVFARDRSVMAQPFDAGKLRTTGDAFPVAQDVNSNQAIGAAIRIIAVSVSESGTLVHVAQGQPEARLTWFDRAGRQQGELGPVAPYGPFALFADEQRCIASINDPEKITWDLLLIDGVRGTHSRMTWDGNQHHFPAIAPDGSRVAFAKYHLNGFFGIFQLPTGGGAEAGLLYARDLSVIPTDWSADGRYVAYGTMNGSTPEDLWVLPLEGDRKPFPVVQSPEPDSQGKFSHDGKWLAYLSSLSGKVELYVQPFAPGEASEGKWQVSPAGADLIAPSWRRDDKELYYVSGGKLMAVDINASGGRFQAGVPKALFPYHGNITTFAPAANGQRFLIAVPVHQSMPSMTIVQNWMSGHTR